MGEIIYDIIVAIFVVLFIVWVIQCVKECKKKNSTPGITEEEKSQNSKMKNIKIIVGVIILFFMNYSFSQVEISSTSYLEILNIILVVLFIVFIFIMITIFKKKKEKIDDEKQVKKLKNIVVLSIIGVFLLFVGIVQLARPYLENKQNIEKEEAIKLEADKKQQEIDNQRQYLADTLMVSRDVLDKIQSVFVDCGLGKIMGVTYIDDYLLDDNSTKESLFNVYIEDRDTNGDQINLILHNDELIHQIILNGKILYEYGKVVDNAKYYYRLTFNQKSEYKYNFEEYIKKQLGSVGDYPKFPKYLDNPSAGDNSYKWGTDSDGTEIAVGWVEHPNYFGVVYRTPFKVYINKKTNRYSVDFLE